MPRREFQTEFEAITAPLAEEQSEEAQHAEWLMYSHEDEKFRRAVTRRVAELVGIQTGKDLFDEQA